LLLKLHRQEIPDFLAGKDDKKTIERWSVEVERLIRIDKKSPENIRQVIIHVKTPGNFWFPNIESGTKLRKKFEVIWGQMQNNKQSTGPPKHKIAADNIPPEEVDKYFRGSK